VASGRSRRWASLGLAAIFVACAALGAAELRNGAAQASGKGRQTGASNQHRRIAITLPHEQLQVRPLLDTVPGPCHTNIRSTPPANRPISLPFPGAFTGCTALGPAVLATRSVNDVVRGDGVSGGQYVGVALAPRDLRVMQVLATTHPNFWYGVVILGRVLNWTTAAGLAAFGRNYLPIASGADVTRLTQQLAEALRISIREIPPPCDLCFSPSAGR
jgi:hypothetical protein